MNLIFKLFCLACLGIVGIIPLVFNIIVGKDYLEAYNHIPILMYATLFNVYSSVFSAFYVAKKNSKALMKTTLLSAALNIILNLLFIDSLGLYAASISTLISYFVMAAIRYFGIKKYVNIKLDFSFFILYIPLTIVDMFAYYSNNSLLNIAMFGLICVFSILNLIPELKSIKKLVKKK